MNIQDALTHTINEMSRSDATKRAYMRACKLFIESISTTLDADVQSIKPSHFSDFPGWLVSQGKYKGASMKLYVAGVSAFRDFLIDNDLMEWSEKNSIRLKNSKRKITGKHQSHLPDVPTREQVIQLCEASMLNKKSPEKERNAAIIKFLFSSGCRVGEIILLKVGDIQENGWILVTGKGDKQRLVRASTEAMEALSIYWTARKWKNNPNDPVFARHDHKVSHKKEHYPLTTTSVRDILSSASTITGLQFSPHKLRHGFAMELYDATGDIGLVQKILGHASINTTKIYAEASTRSMEEGHKKAFE